MHSRVNRLDERSRKVKSGRAQPLQGEIPSVIQARKLTRRFRDVVGLEGLDLDVRRGEVFGLLGPNGAGKTTTLRLLTGIMRPTSGCVRVLGVDVVRDPERAKSQIGYVAQAVGLYGDLSVEEHLEFYAALYGRPDRQLLDQLVERYGFSSLRSRLARDLSGGYRTRLALLTALVHRPAVLFLDEPTSGVDPVTRKELWDLFYSLKGEGVTLLVSTHYMEEAERCDRLAFLVQGRLAALGTPVEVKCAVADRDVFEVRTSYQPEVAARLVGLPGFDTFNQFGSVLRVICRKGSVTTESLADWLAPLDATPPEVRVGEPTLEDAFVILTRRAETGAAVLGPARAEEQP